MSSSVRDCRSCVAGCPLACTGGCTHVLCMGGCLSPEQTFILYNGFWEWANERRRKINEDDCNPGDKVSLRTSTGGPYFAGTISHALAEDTYDIEFFTRNLPNGKPDTTSPRHTVQGVKRKHIRLHVSTRMPTEQRRKLVRSLKLTKGYDEVGNFTA